MVCEMDDSSPPAVVTYHGKNIDTMTREELIDAFKDVAAQIEIIAGKAAHLVTEYRGRR